MTLLNLDETRACGDSTVPPEAASLDKAWTDYVVDPSTAASVIGSSWHACGTLRDGRRIVLGEQQLDSDASRLLALIGTSTVLDLGRVSLGKRCWWEMLSACHVSGS